jgi:hypothetical protein
MIKREYHGLRDRSEYKVWAGIKQRCRNPKNPSYARYGGAGITMCDEWANSFTTFLADMGSRPSMDHSIDRRDGTLGYTTSNCRWATDFEQAQNQSTTRFVTFNGETLCLSEWSRRLGIPVVTVWSRLNSGKTVDQALTMPNKGKRSSSSLSDEAVFSIRCRAANGENGKQIARAFGIHHTTACRIISGKTFKAIALAEEAGQ